MESHRTWWKVRSQWPSMTWRRLKTSRNDSFWLRLAKYFIYIRELKSLCRYNNANYLFHFNKLWKPGRLVRLLQFWTNILENPSHSQRIDSTPQSHKSGAYSILQNKLCHQEKRLSSTSTAWYGIRPLDTKIWWQPSKRDLFSGSSKELRTCKRLTHTATSAASEAIRPRAVLRGTV